MFAFFQAVPGGTEQLHQFLDVITPIALGAVFVAGLMIRATMAESATKHVQAAAEVKAELVQHNSELKEDLAVHMAEDRLQFNGINQKLDRIEKHSAGA